MEFLSEKVDGALIAQKYAERHWFIRATSTQQRPFMSTLNSRSQGERRETLGTLSVCFVNQRVTGPKNVRK
jgi:hypothetical protein